MRRAQIPLSAGCVIVLLLLCLAQRLHPSRKTFPVPEPLQRVVHAMSNRGLNRADSAGMAAGYYEGLLDASKRIASAGSLLTRMDLREAEWKRVAQFNHRRHRRRGDFLYYELVPGITVKDHDATLHTSGQGLADRSYPLRPAEGTQRIAFLGDSVTRGQGVDAGLRYESLLEAEIDRRRQRDRGQRCEILNFAVGGYRITQMFQVAIEKVPAFSPDLVVLCMTDLTVFRKWGHHLAQLVHDGIDLEYPFLEAIVAESGLTRDDPVAVFDARLEAYRMRTLEEILHQLRDRSRAFGAELAVLLVPTATPAAHQKESFTEVEELLDRLSIPCANLLDAFAAVEDLDAIRIRPGDAHPDAEGHRLIYEEFLENLEGSPRWRRLLSID